MQLNSQWNCGLKNFQDGDHYFIMASNGVQWQTQMANTLSTISRLVCTLSGGIMMLVSIDIVSIQKIM